MNERGFFTIVGLCLLIVAAIFVKGISEFETNYSRGITNYKAEHYLQNLAESYLVENIDLIENLPIKRNLGNISCGKFTLENVRVEVYGERGNIQFFQRVYKKNKNPTDERIKDSEGNDLTNDGKIILSVASCDSPLISGKMYRRAFAYILDDDETTEDIDESKTIHFMNDL